MVIAQQRAEDPCAEIDTIDPAKQFFSTKSEYKAAMRMKHINKNVTRIRRSEVASLAHITHLRFKEDLPLKPMKKWVDDEVFLKKFNTEDEFPRITHIKVLQ